MKEKYFNGRINLSAIPKDIIRTDSRGNKYIYVDIKAKKKPDEYGNTHHVTCSRKSENGYETVYLGNLQEKEFMYVEAAKSEETEPVGNEDLPF